MPRYDYRCEAGHQYERTEPFGSPAAHACDRCGRPARRVPVAPPLVFKSGGFYKTSERNGSSSASDGDAKGVRSKAPPKKAAEGADAGPATPTAPSSAAASSDD